MSILFKFSCDFMSISLYSAEGLYTMIGLYWLLSETGISKSEMMFERLELFPLLVRLLLLVSSYVRGGASVCRNYK